MITTNKFSHSILCSLMAVVLFAISGVCANAAVFKGKVLDETGAPAIGAGVMVKGQQSLGTITDVNGEFTLNLNAEQAVLVISYLGYKTQEISASAGRDVIVSLELDSSMMEEVVVTGYGTFKKSAYAGSASNMRAEKLAEIPATSFMDLVQGNAPGVTFSQPSGQPGSASVLNIRGMGSFNASTSPLYVIDGIPVMSGDISATGSDAGLDLMSTISNSDIESITIIKDAAAASLYGSRAANGVVVITTKHGRVGKPTISFKADWGKSDFAMKYRPVMNGEQRRKYVYDSFYNQAIYDGDSPEKAKEYADEYVEEYAPLPWTGEYTDWDDILFKKGSHSNYEVSIAGGTDKFTYFSSLSNMTQDGVTLNSGLQRTSARMNAEYRATDRFKMGANVLFSKVKQDVYSEGTSYTSPFYSSRNCVIPSDVPFLEDGSWNRDFIDNGDRNPLLAATYDSNKEYVTRAFNTIYAQYEFIPNLAFKSTLSYDYITTRGEDWSDPRTSNGDDYNGAMEVSYYERAKMVWANHLTYNVTIADKHHLDALAGFEMDDQSRKYISASATNFATPEKNVLSNGKTIDGVGGSNNATRLASYITRVNYDYDNRYYFGASWRADGSSRLASDKRWGNFWSVSGAWRIIEEDFMDNVRALSDLRLRASYGVNGTLPSDYYGYYGLSSLSVGYQGQPGIVLSQIENKDLSWETNHNFNLGLDFGFANRVNFIVEYYNRDTRNLLMDRPISMTTGFGTYLMNIGEVRNRGVEFEVNSQNIVGRNFTWNTSLNISHNTNKVLSLDGFQTEIAEGTQIRKVGYPYRTFYLLEFAGINPETGIPQFYTNEPLADGTLSKEITEDPSKAQSIVTKEHAEPAVVGGLSNSFRYKWFDLNFLFSFQFGGYSYDTWAQKTEHGGYEYGRNFPAYYADNWQKPGDITNYEMVMEDPVVRMSSYASTRRLHSTDFLRLKTLQFGVTLPDKWLNFTGAESVRLYAAANNLWTWAKWDYYDPEAVNNGTAIWGTPPLKTITFGVNINF